MRLIGTLADEQKALTFSLFLHQKGIEHQLEILKNTDWGSPNYGTSQCKIWIVDEENLEEALKWHHLFIENPMDPQFNLLKTEQLPLIRSSHPLSSAPLPIVEEGSNPIIPPGTHPVQTWQDRPMGMITRLIILLCSTLFLASQVFMLNNKVPDNLPFIATLTSPIEKNLLYDFPKTYELLAQFVKVYGVDKLEDPTSMPPEGQKLLKQINQTPTWIGLYNLIEKKGFKSLKHPFQQPMFEKIKQGEVWRIVSPAFLHSGIFHIFFNMLWLIALGKQIEQRLGAFRYILFILIVAALSNTAEYLISGPNFLGFSGVVCGMLTFIWMRQRYAAWENYQLDQVTLIFILLYIVLLGALQVLSFFLEMFFNLSIPTGIANGAHLIGALIGLILGRMNFFSWRHT